MDVATEGRRSADVRGEEAEEEGLDGGRPLAAETAERKRLRREDDARKSVFQSMSAWSQLVGRDPTFGSRCCFD